MTMTKMNAKINFVFAALFGEDAPFAQSLLGPEGREMAKAVWESATLTQHLFGGNCTEHIKTTFAPVVEVQFPLCPSDFPQMQKMSEAVRSLTHAKGHLRHSFLTQKFLRQERKVQFALSKLG